MKREDNITNKIDWVTVLIYCAIVFLGWLNIYAVTYDENAQTSIFSLDLNSGRQLVFIGGSLIIIAAILIIDRQFYETFAYIIYGLLLFMLLLVPIIGKEVGGNKAWLGIGSFGVQPSEFAKFATALVVAKTIGSIGFKMDNLRNQLILFALIGTPMFLILLQKDTGTAMVFSVFVLVFFREGMSPFLIIIGIACAVILIIDRQFYETFAYIIYGLLLFMLLLVPIIGKEVGGNKAWLGIGSFGVQPSEFAKFATALVVAKTIGSIGFKMDNLRNQLILFALIGTPMFLILLQKDTGTAMVFSVFVLVFFREGMSPFLIIIGIACAVIFVLTLLVDNQLYLHVGVAVLLILAILMGRKKFKRIAMLTAGALAIVMVIASVDYIVSDVLKPHQQNRIKALINPDADPLGFGWNVTQSKIAIGSGGFLGKGFLEGTQTKFDFVPEQSTDFIFCTIGEEHGWIGSLFTIALFMLLLLRILFLAERQKNKFARVYGYSVACILFFHFAVNIGMTIGLFPVIGIPLPFFSYGGSSLWGFTILLFIFLKLDAHRMQVLQRL